MADEGLGWGRSWEKGVCVTLVEGFPQRAWGWSLSAGQEIWVLSSGPVLGVRVWPVLTRSEHVFQSQSQMRAVHVPIKPMGQSQLLLPLRSHVLSQTVNLLLTISADTVSDTSNSSCLCGRVAWSTWMFSYRDKCLASSPVQRGVSFAFCHCRAAQLPLLGLRNMIRSPVSVCCAWHWPVPTPAVWKSLVNARFFIYSSLQPVCLYLSNSRITSNNRISQASAVVFQRSVFYVILARNMSVSPYYLRFFWTLTVGWDKML